MDGWNECMDGVCLRYQYKSSTKKTSLQGMIRHGTMAVSGGDLRC